MAPPFPPTRLTAERLPAKQIPPASQTGLAMTGALAHAGTRDTTTERGHDTPPNKTHSEPKPAVATLSSLTLTIGVCSKSVLTGQRKGKPDAMAISHSSVGWLSRAGTGKLLARRRAQFIKDPCADYGVNGGSLAAVRGALYTIRKHGGQGRTVAVVACGGSLAEPGAGVLDGLHALNPERSEGEGDAAVKSRG